MSHLPDYILNSDAVHLRRRSKYIVRPLYRMPKMGGWLLSGGRYVATSTVYVPHACFCSVCNLEGRQIGERVRRLGIHSRVRRVIRATPILHPSRVCDANLPCLHELTNRLHMHRGKTSYDGSLSSPRARGTVSMAPSRSPLSRCKPNHVCAGQQPPKGDTDPHVPFQ